MTAGPATGSQRLRGARRQWRALRQLPRRVPLRVKMITAVLALVAIALMAISVAGVSFLRSYLLRQADGNLASVMPGYASNAVNLCLIGAIECPGTSPFPGYSVDWLAEGHTKVTHVQQPVSRLVSVRGVSGQSLRGLTEPGPDVQPVLHWLIYHPNQPTTVTATSGHHRWRVVAIQTSVATQAGPVTGDIIAGMDVTNVYDTMRRLISIDLIVSAIVVVALAMVGAAIVRSSLRPLTDIESTAGAIAAGDLSRRVPDLDPRTEVGRLGRSLNQMLAQIEAAFWARAQSEAAARRSEERMRQFVADASHELRTPLTAIRGYAEYYRQRGGVTNGEAATDGTRTSAGHSGQTGNGAAGAPSGPAGAPSGPAGAPSGPAGAPSGATPAGRPTPEHPAAPPTAAAPKNISDGGEALSSADMDRIMERVEQESSRMGGLVEDMLLLARLDEQRPVDRRPVDLLSLTADAVQDARMIAPDRQIGLTVGKGTAFLVLGDEARLRQVISNLMSNALTHTPDGTEISVRVIAGDAHTVILEVADHGPGMKAEQADRVFERFYRADAARGRKTGGTGLGLAIVHALVSAHGGTVGIDTAPGRGSTFRITLPLAPEAQPPAPPPSGEQAQSPQPREAS